MISKRWMITIAACFASSLAHAATIGFASDWSLGNAMYSFNPDSTSTPATSIFTNITNPDCIAVSPDGKTVYFTSNTSGVDGGDVYSFPTLGPYVPTALGTGITNPIGIAISSDGTTGFVTDDSDIWSFPINGSDHTATQLTPTGNVISTPTLITISGDTAYVAEYGNYMTSTIYSFPVDNSGNYNASPVLTNDSTYAVNGLVVSNDNLYFASNVNSNVNATIYKVSLSSLPASATAVSTQFFAGFDGLAISEDGKTLYISSIGNGIYTLPTNSGSPIDPTLLTGLDFPNGTIAVALASVGSGPTNLSGVQKKNDFGLTYEFYNVLEWQPSPGSTVVGYFIYRNGVKIASVSATREKYEDHNRKKNASDSYSVTAYYTSGIESSPSNTVQIN